MSIHAALSVEDLHKSFGKLKVLSGIDVGGTDLAEVKDFYSQFFRFRAESIKKKTRLFKSGEIEIYSIIAESDSLDSDTVP